MRNVIVAIALIGIACGPGAPKAGTVVDTRYEPYREWEETYYTTQCISHNEDGGCISSISIPHQRTRRDDEDWMVKLEECKYDDSGNRKCRAGWREIDRQDWEALGVGDFYGERQE